MCFCRRVSVADPIIYIAFPRIDISGVLFKDWIFFFLLSGASCCLWRLSSSIVRYFSRFVSSFCVLSAPHSIGQTSFHCLVFNTNRAKCYFWFELSVLILLISVLVLISFNIFFVLWGGGSYRTTHFSGNSFSGGSFSRGSDNYFFYLMVHFKSSSTHKITPYWNIFQFLVWWLIAKL